MDPSFLITQVTEEQRPVDNLPTKAILTNGHVVNRAGDGQVGNKVGLEAKTNDIRKRFLPNLLASHKWHKNGDVKPGKIFNSILCCLCMPQPNILSKMSKKSSNSPSNQSQILHRPSTDPRSPGNFVANIRDLGQQGLVKQNGHVTSPLSTNGTPSTLLPRLLSVDRQKLCVVIDLDETLVHSSFKPVNNADYIVPVNIDNIIHHVYVMKRPHVDTFLQRVGERFECILFTASLAKYADPVADLLDPARIFKARLFREACVFHQGNYVKDLNKLGRDTEKVVIIDNSPASYVFHPQNAIPISSWFGDAMDRELLNVLPILDKVHAERAVTRVLAAEIGNGVRMSPKAQPET